MLSIKNTLYLGLLKYYIYCFYTTKSASTVFKSLNMRIKSHHVAVCALPLLKCHPLKQYQLSKRSPDNKWEWECSLPNQWPAMKMPGTLKKCLYTAYMPLTTLISLEYHNTKPWRIAHHFKWILGIKHWPFTVQLIIILAVCLKNPCEILYRMYSYVLNPFPHTYLHFIFCSLSKANIITNRWFEK